MGLSPRVRGNLPNGRPTTRSIRSIPACAGEPLKRTPRRPESWVYPRVCGGTSSLAACSISFMGLSPRVRGNQKRLDVFGSRLRSIPACAGEPSSSGVILSQSGVYPRVCGGTGRDEDIKSAIHGLSPRVRGNQSMPGDYQEGNGSIPACAGEPPGDTGEKCWCKVYPRVCGGTAISSRVK